jgi:hypothetical protein
MASMVFSSILEVVMWAIKNGAIIDIHQGGMTLLCKDGEMVRAVVCYC